MSGAIAVLAIGVAVHPAPVVQRVEAVVSRVTGRAKPAAAPATIAPDNGKKDAGAPSGFDPTLPGCNAAPAPAPKPAATPGAPPDFVTMGSCGDTSKPTAPPPAHDPKKPGGH